MKVCLVFFLIQGQQQNIYIITFTAYYLSDLIWAHSHNFNGKIYHSNHTKQKTQFCHFATTEHGKTNFTGGRAFSMAISMSFFGQKSSSCWFQYNKLIFTKCPNFKSYFLDVIKRRFLLRDWWKAENLTQVQRTGKWHIYFSKHIGKKWLT